MRYLFILVISFLCSATFVFAQEKPGQQETPKAYVFAEFGKIGDRNLEKQMQDFFRELDENPSARGYIINYGKAAEKALLLKRMLNTSPFQRRLYDASRITIVDGGEGSLKKQRTVLWIVPYGAENPLP